MNASTHASKTTAELTKTLYKTTMKSTGELDDLLRTYTRALIYDAECPNLPVEPTPAYLSALVSTMELLLASIKGEVAKTLPEPPCPRPEHCPQKHTYAKKELSEEEKAERKRKQEEREAKEKKDLEKVDEVEVSRSYRITAKETISKDDWLSEHGEGVPEHRQDAYWAEYLHQWGVSIQHGGRMAEIELEEREEDDNGNYEVDIDDDSPDANDVAKDFVEDDRVCVLSGYKHGEEYEDKEDGDDLVETELGWMKRSIADHLSTIKELLLAKKA
jgi:hypothetical protein